VAWNSGGQGDVLVVNKKGWLIENEVKTSLTDLQTDRNKPKHYHLYLDYYKDVNLLPDVKGWRRHKDWLAHRHLWTKEDYNYPISLFYFAVPAELSTDALRICKKLYPYAGLIELSNLDQLDWIHYSVSTNIVKEPYFFKRPELNASQNLHIYREMSATICRLSMQIEQLKADMEQSKTKEINNI